MSSVCFVACVFPCWSCIGMLVSQPFQHWCVFVVGRRAFAVFFSRQLKCSCGQRQHRPTYRRSAQWKAACPPRVSRSLQLNSTHEQVSWCTYSTHRAWACVVIERRLLTSPNLTVIISACPHSNNTLLSFGGTVTPGYWELSVQESLFLLHTEFTVRTSK